MKHTQKMARFNQLNICEKRQNILIFLGSDLSSFRLGLTKTIREHRLVPSAASRPVCTHPHTQSLKCGRKSQ